MPIADCVLMIAHLRLELYGEDTWLAKRSVNLGEHFAAITYPLPKMGNGQQATGADAAAGRGSPAAAGEGALCAAWTSLPLASPCIVPPQASSWSLLQEQPPTCVGWWYVAAPSSLAARDAATRQAAREERKGGGKEEEEECKERAIKDNARVKTKINKATKAGRDFSRFVN